MVCRYNAESHLILQLHALWAIQGQRRLCVSTHNRFRGKLRRLLQSKANKTISIQIHWCLGWEFTTPHFTPCFYHQGAALRSVGLTLRLESSSSVPASACSQPLLCPTLPQQQELLKMLQPLKAVCCRNDPPNNSVLLHYSATSFWKTGPHTKCSQDVAITAAFGSGVIWGVAQLTMF